MSVWSKVGKPGRKKYCGIPGSYGVWDFMVEVATKQREKTKQNPAEEHAYWFFLEHGIHLNRQVLCGKRVFDFYYPRKALVVEIDGKQHNAQWDQERDAWFKKNLGVTTLRVKPFSLPSLLEAISLLRSLGTAKKTISRKKLKRLRKLLRESKEENNLKRKNGKKEKSREELGEPNSFIPSLAPLRSGASGVIRGVKIPDSQEKKHMAGKTKVIRIRNGQRLTMIRPIIPENDRPEIR